MKKALFIVLAVVLAMGLLIGCASQDIAGQTAGDTAGQATPAPTAKNLLDDDTDALGNEIDTDMTTDELTIVSTAASITEILFALGCGDSIIGVDIYSTYPEEAADIEKIGDFNGFDTEKIISLNPAVVFAGNTLQMQGIEALEDAGLNVVAVEPTYYEDIAQSITLIGSIVGKEEEAAALNQDMADAAAAVEKTAAEIGEKPTVYYVMFIGESGNWTSGQGSFINTVIEMAGGVCTTAGTQSEWLEYPMEDLIVDDPDILLVSDLVAEEDLLAETGYADLTAVQNGSYYFIDADIIERPGPRITEALETIQGTILDYTHGE
ncbi:MAG: ABC transporter substrate-binding protein [Eubacteriales bacterium]|nr:ABC transporter substrate-binding protein [Eubacteriales bacterium]